MDEVSLETSLLYDAAKDEVVAIIQIFYTNCCMVMVNAVLSKVATSAVAFMVCGITDNWKKPSDSSTLG